MPALSMQAAFPTILARCRSILQRFAANQRASPATIDSERLEEVVCVLEVRNPHTGRLLPAAAQCVSMVG
jgi:hypothetical protein